MIFMPKNRNRIIATVFPLLKFGTSPLQYVTQFKYTYYLDYIITHSRSDDDDIQRAIYVCALQHFNS